MHATWFLSLPLLLLGCTERPTPVIPPSGELLIEKTAQTVKDAQVGDATLSYAVVNQRDARTGQVLRRNVVAREVALTIDAIRPVVEEFIRQHPTTYALYFRLEPRQPVDDVVAETGNVVDLRTGPLLNGVNPTAAPAPWAGGPAFMADSHPFNWPEAVAELQRTAAQILANRAADNARFELMLSVYDRSRFFRSAGNVVGPFSSATAPNHAQGGPWLTYRAWTITY